MSGSWMTEYALALAKDIPFETPVDLLDRLVDPVWEYGKKITGRNNLRMTFALNALMNYVVPPSHCSV